MNKIELLRMRWVFKKAIKAMRKYACMVHPDEKADVERMRQVGIETISTLEHLTDQEFTFVMSVIGCAVLESSKDGVEKAMRRMEEEKKK